MSLGILAVYLVDPIDEPLLDLHLRQIEECTTVPYTLYAAVNRLSPQLVKKLQHRSDVKICPCPITDLRKKEEHSFYLEHLVRIAVQDGATHVVTLHADSFPIRRGWSEGLRQRLSRSCAVITLNRISTACLFFHRDFYLNHGPRFLLSDTDRSSPSYETFCAQWRPIDHSGAGYGFKAFCEGLSLSYLKESNRNTNATFGIVYENLVCHLVGAAGIGRARPAEYDGGVARRRRLTSLLALARRLHVSLGPSTRHLISGLLPASYRRTMSRQIYSEATAKLLFEQAKSELLRDPRAYWESLIADRDHMRNRHDPT